MGPPEEDAVGVDPADGPASPWPLLRLFAVLADIAATAADATAVPAPPLEEGGAPDDTSRLEAA